MVGAQEIPGYPPVEAFDAREVAMLPPYCKHTFYFRDKVPGGGSAEQLARWRSVLGPPFENLHHYCLGIMKTNRAVLLARDAQVRQFYLNDSLHEFDFVIDRSPDSFILLPEILNKKGENLVRLNKGPQAVLQFERAVALRPDFWPPFANLSDYYKELGEVPKARESLERGLVGSPGATALTRRLKELETVGRNKPAAKQP
jgi:tetratricopeptide (TPR) repeat protein